MNVSLIDAWRRPGCASTCVPRSHDPAAHEGHGFALALLTQRVAPVRIVRTGPLVIDLVGARVTVDGRLVRLSGREWSILAHLATRVGRFCPTSEIMADVYGPGYGMRDLDVTLNRLRAKLAPYGQMIVTVSRHGGRSGRRLEQVDPT